MKNTINHFILILAALVAFVSPALYAQQNKNAATLKKSGYAPVNGMKMYYEIHGEGKPIVLLHGAYMNIEGMFRDLIAEYAKTRKVIALEFQNHGRTNDINRDITYEALADDVHALVQYLKLDSVDVFAYSMGSGVAVQWAIRYPKEVKKMVLLSGSYSYEGLHDAFKPLVPTITPAMFEGTPFKTEYEKLAPEPKNFTVLVEKLKKLDMTDFNWEADYVKIRQPMLLVFGDNDVVTLKHAVDMFTKLGGNVMGDMAPMPAVRLAVLPYTSHMGMMTRVSWVNEMAHEFLDQK